MRRVAAAVALALAACGGGLLAACGGGSDALRSDDAIGQTHDASHHDAPPPPAGTGRGRAPTPREEVAIGRLVTTAERIRALRFARAVPVRVLDAAAIRESLSHEMKDEDLHDAEVLYTALGLLPPATDVRQLMLAVLGEQVVGFYDTHAKELVVRDDVMAELAGRASGGSLDQSGMVLVHELVHALQDQDLDIGATYDLREGQPTDAGDSFRSLVEGDATLAMIGYLAEQAVAQQGGDARARATALSRLTARHDLLAHVVTDATPPSGDELSRAPAIVRETLLSSYMDGMLFCATLHARGGFAAVDDAYRTPPSSTEQILHPEKYLAHEEPETLAIPAIAALDAAGLTEAVLETLGELEISIYFAQAGDAATAKAAAAGWSGDRVRVLRDGRGATSVVWLTRWDDEHEALEAQAAAQRVAALAQAEARARQLVARSGRDVLIVRDLDPALHAAVRSALLSP